MRHAADTLDRHAPVEFRSASSAYREIKRRIVELHYSPGRKLSEARLAIELGLGRSPIRTALARLQGEGWIAVSPQSGTYVRGLSAEETHDILNLRLVLEPYVAGLAAQNITDEELGDLRQAFQAFGSKVTQSRMDEYLTLDSRVHLAIYRAAGNQTIAKILSDLMDKIHWTRRGSTGDLNRIQQAFQEIKRIVQALEVRDAAAAAAAMQSHISNTAAFRRTKMQPGNRSATVAARKTAKARRC
jgi:DNA-binding GntR family transcriptional regulator